MSDKGKSMEELIKELQVLRSRVEQLERMGAEGALANERNLLRTLIDSLPDRIYVKDTSSRFIVCNKAVADDSGAKNPEELLGKTDFDLYPRENAQAYYNEEQQVMRTGVPLINEERPGVSGTGDPVWALNTKVTWRDGSGKVIGIVGANRDITARKKAEEAFRESEQRYKMVVDNIGIGVSLIGPKMEVLSLNERMKKWFPGIDVSTKPLCYKSFNDPPRDEVCSYCPTFRTLQDGQIHEAVTETPVGGRTVNFRVVSSPIRDSDGHIIAAIEVVEDITEHRHAEEALRESEQRYRLLVEQVPAITYTAALDEASTTIYVSPQIEQIIGASQVDYKAEPDFWRKRLHPEDRERVIREVAHSHKTGEPFVSEYRMIATDGRTVWIHDEAGIIRDDKGKPLYLQGVMYDITERKRAEEFLQKAHDELETSVEQRTADLARAVEKLRNEIAERKHAEEALRKAEERFRTIFENTVIGLYRTTPDGRILLANPAIVKMLGYDSFEELARVNLEHNGIDVSTPRSVFKEVVEKEGRIIGLESVWLRRDKTKLFVRESAVAVRDERGKVLYYEGTVEDITERKKAEEQLFTYQQRLRSLASELSLAEERLRRRIATDVHDNISQNLAISKMKLESLAESAQAAGLAEPLTEVLELIGQTIESTRSLTFEMSPPVLYELGFEAAVGWLARQTRQRYGLEVEFKDDGKDKPLDDDVKVFLFQAVRELLVNVVKHAGAHKAQVSARRIRDELQVTVEDDGVGFDVSKAGPSDRTGSFGLFSVRERLDHIGGRVSIESKPGRGTRVTLTAPVNGRSRTRKETKK
jgi:PAS domain S-box-containing protein